MKFGSFTSSRFIVGMALTLDALEGSLKQFTKLGEGGRARINGNFGPLSQLVYDLKNMVGLYTR
jgi:hypothetical protein